jgi:putative DeoR family transcriptional regulator (stage III sporulation protein D)
MKWVRQMDPEMKERILLGAELLLLEQSNVRKVARRLGCSKSTVHKDLSERLPYLDMQLFEQVQALFQINKQEKHLRGGEATKRKYLVGKKISR